VDVRERRQLELAQHMAKVKARTRPWWSIAAFVLAIGAVGVSHVYGKAAVNEHAGITNPDIIVADSMAFAFCLLGVGATMGLSGKARDALQPTIGSMHASLVRIVLVLAGLLTTVSVTLALFGLPVTQLILGGAIFGVLLGIAAQQTLANLFAGIVLLQARPFAVGDTVWIRSGALGGQYEGTATEIGLTYVRLNTGDGPICLPNTQVLAAATGPSKPCQSGASAPL